MLGWRLRTRYQNKPLNRASRCWIPLQINFGTEHLTPILLELLLLARRESSPGDLRAIHLEPERQRVPCWTPDPSLSFGYLDALVSAMAGYNNVKFISIMSLLLPDGERGQVARPPAVVDGTLSINMRKHSSLVENLDELQAEGAFDNWTDVSGATSSGAPLTPEDQQLLALKNDGRMREFLELAVESCRNIIVAGETGSGKATFARSLRVHPCVGRNPHDRGRSRALPAQPSESRSHDLRHGRRAHVGH